MTKLPYNFNFDDIALLKALNKVNHTLGRLNGAINLLPNPYIIFNAITLGEAKESSEIENIVTTFDEIFKEMSLKRYHKSADLKTRKIKEGKLWSSTVKNLRNRHCYCQMR